MRQGVVRKRGAVGGQELAADLAADSEECAVEVCVILVADMNYMDQVANQPRTVEGDHFGNLLVVGSQQEGKIAVAGTVDLVGIAVGFERIEELVASIQVVVDKAVGKLP